MTNKDETKNILSPQTAQTDLKDNPAQINADKSLKHKGAHTPLSSKLAIGLAALAIGAVSYAIYTCQQIHRQLNSTIISNQALSQQTLDVTNQIKTLAATENELNTKLANLDKTVQTVLQQDKYQTSDWLMLNARYYLELAIMNATWSNNPQTTIALLQHADTLLATIHDQRLVIVRQTIAAEITQVKQMQNIDLIGLLSQLDAVQHSVSTLPIKRLSIDQEQSPTSETQMNTHPTWRSKLQESIQRLKKLVIIRHHNNDQPMLTPDYEAIIRESIQLNLQNAQWAALQNNAEIYQLSLKQALDHLQNTFELKATATLATLKQLNELQQISLIDQKIIPDQSLAKLNAVIESKPALTDPAPGEPAQ
jgi:uroporphyrin-3 C-methyltransferase